VWLGGKLQAGAAIKQTREAARQQHNSQAARAIAQLRLTTDGLSPDSFIWEQEHGESRERIRAIIEELRAQQVPLMTVAVGHPSQAVRDGMQDVLSKSYKALPDLSAFVATFSGLEEGQSHGENMPEKREKAKESWQALRDAIDDLVAAMHEEAE
jgi:ribosomal protein S5